MVCRAVQLHGCAPASRAPFPQIPAFEARCIRPGIVPLPHRTAVGTPRSGASPASLCPRSSCGGVPQGANFVREWGPPPPAATPLDPPVSSTFRPSPPPGLCRVHRRRSGERPGAVQRRLGPAGARRRRRAFRPRGGKYPHGYPLRARDAGVGAAARRTAPGVSPGPARGERRVP